MLIEFALVHSKLEQLKETANKTGDTFVSLLEQERTVDANVTTSKAIIFHTCRDSPTVKLEITQKANFR